ncbi:Cu(I)/Ag(I) efflux system membrane fusion protein [Sphingobium sp. OAS761]|uniref:efflux RND transporter periplasmic adaptor subunit n=1 Tax=Sphingobium sp. OAS761 TaxID=2817901 RepID=UPI00209D1425|nr:efflux RND transporter periplasmic adaptor subunit [Sphingobium sp. OAS761]MCP1471965.1 Cu(I)/Ag(I) efflux system membrane fusion protein [Sphingobium sp. OAS761]
MSQVTIARGWLFGAAAALALAAGGIGFTLADRQGAKDSGAAKPPARKILYWYDPMIPAEHHDGPGLSSMGMQTIPRYADEEGAGAAAPGISVDASAAQALGLRTVAARRGELASSLTATGTIDFNQRDVAVIQARAGGFVNRVYARAPGDVIGGGAPLADILVPEWAGAQSEFLAVRRTGNAALIQAARQRLTLLGMPASMIASVERSGRAHNVITISTPVGGVIKTLGVRAGMTVMAGQTLAEVNGVGTVWLNAAVPEAVAGPLRPSQTVQATLAAFPGETLTGRVSAVLPETQTDSRTLTVRIELPNRGGRLRPGMFATVSFGGSAQTALLVPSEALIRTGKRTLVMLALDKGRYRPAEVQPGRQSGDKTEILAGLSEGEKIVASGQFLIDSEASLSGIQARPIAGTTAKPVATASLYESVGKIEQITAKSVTLSHEAVPVIGWPAMTMTFQLGNPALVRGYKTGDRVRFAFDQPPAGPTVRRMAKVAGR